MEYLTKLNIIDKDKGSSLLPPHQRRNKNV
jgi:hypothetical protein